MHELRIGLVYETFETYPRLPGDPVDAHVEFEPESTIEALEAAIAFLGHRPIRLGSPSQLLARVAETESKGPLEVDVALNLAEGSGGRNREAWAPVLLEMAGIPTIGSDALSLSLSLDKAWTNRWVASVGVPVAPQITIASAHRAADVELPAPFPLFVKPRWEGTDKGIRESSRVRSREELVREVARICGEYDQPALVEAFVDGAEYTVTLIGNDSPQVLPVLQRGLESQSRIGLHALEGVRESDGAGTTSTESDFEYVTEGELDPVLESRLGDLAVRVFETLECFDFARVDFRLDSRCEPVFLEINPLPTFAIDGSFAILAELEGCSLSEMLGRCVLAGLERLGLVAKGGGSKRDE